MMRKNVVVVRGRGSIPPLDPHAAVVSKLQEGGEDPLLLSRLFFLLIGDRAGLLLDGMVAADCLPQDLCLRLPPIRP